LREAGLFGRGVFGAESRRGYNEIANAVFPGKKVADVCGDRYPTSLLCSERGLSAKGGPAWERRSFARAF